MHRRSSLLCIPSARSDLEWIPFASSALSVTVVVSPCVVVPLTFDLYAPITGEICKKEDERRHEQSSDTVSIAHGTSLASADSISHPIELNPLSYRFYATISVRSFVLDHFNPLQNLTYIHVSCEPRSQTKTVRHCIGQAQIEYVQQLANEKMDLKIVKRNMQIETPLMKDI